MDRLLLTTNELRGVSQRTCTRARREVVTANAELPLRRPTMLLKTTGLLAALAPLAFVALQDGPEIPPDPGPMRTDDASEPAELAPELRRFAEEVGTWKAELSAFMSPGMPPLRFEGTETNRMIGDAWLLSTLEAEPAGQPYTGVGQIGYDVTQGRAVKTWIESDSSALNVWYGTYDMERRERILEYTIKDDQGTERTRQIKSRVLDPDRRTLDIIELDETSGEVPILHIDYTLIER